MRDGARKAGQVRSYDQLAHSITPSIHGNKRTCPAFFLSCVVRRPCVRATACLQAVKGGHRIPSQS